MNFINTQETWYVTSATTVCKVHIFKQGCDLESALVGILGR